MPTLALFVTSIDSVRDIFGAAPDLAARLRAVAVERFTAPPPPQRTLLGRLGPLFRRHPETEVRLGQPIPRDVEALLSGAFVEPDRLAHSWPVLLAWLEYLAPHHTTIRVDDWDAVEYDLGRAGLPSQFALRHLAARDLGIPLRPLAGQVTGYSKLPQVLETRAQLHALLDRPDHDLEPATLEAVGPLLALLDQVSSEGTPPQDLVVIQPVDDVPPAA